MTKILTKSNKKMIFGVCGGIAEYFNIDPTLVRLGMVGLSLCVGFGVIMYLIAAIIIPRSE